MDLGNFINNFVGNIKNIICLDDYNSYLLCHSTVPHTLSTFSY